jgi:hypothetical protein
MGTMKDPTLRETYQRLVRRGEPVPVRAAALRALGQLGRPNGQTWPADIIVDALVDPDEAVRLEAVRALNGTADFSHAESLYDRIKPEREGNTSVREEAWAVLRDLFNEADNGALGRWADRAPIKDVPDRRIDVLNVLAKRLYAEKNLRDLATVQANIGDAKMTLVNDAVRAGDLERAKTRAGEADKYFDLALEYYRSKHANDNDMTTGALTERRMDALLAAGDYPKATDFAANSIAINPANQEPMGTKLRNEVDRLRGNGKADDAIKLIDAINKMRTPLAPPVLDFIRQVEQDLRSRSPAPRSAIGNIQESAGNGQ